jgi:hypothetical protein
MLLVHSQCMKVPVYEEARLDAALAGVLLLAVELPLLPQHRLLLLDALLAGRLPSQT